MNFSSRSFFWQRVSYFPWNCVVAVSLWWRKLTPDGTNANQVTSQRLADMGNAATFYDALVEVATAPEPVRPTGRVTANEAHAAVR